MYKDYKLVLCSSLILLLVLGSLPLAGAEEDFDYSLSYELGSSVVEQGGELAVTVTLIGRYVSSEPYDLDRQVEAIVEILFDGSAIGEATIPAGPMKLIPYQDITISETVPGLVPLDASPGTHDIIVRCYLSALGYEVEERKAFTIDVIQAVEGALPEAPKIYLSLSPSQTCIGGTSTLTVRIFNPNDAPMNVGISLDSEAYGKESSLGSYEFELESGRCKEIRRTFRFINGDAPEICFKARLDWYETGGVMQFSEIGDHICITLLKSPSIRPSISFDDYQPGEEDFCLARMTMSFTNESGWDRSLLVDMMAIDVLLPEDVRIVEGEQSSFSHIRKDFIISMLVELPLEETYDTRSFLEGHYEYGEPSIGKGFMLPFNLPGNAYIRAMMGLGPLGGSEDDGNGPALGLTSLIMGDTGDDSKDMMNEVFSYIDQIFG